MLPRAATFPGKYSQNDHDMTVGVDEPVTCQTGFGPFDFGPDEEEAIAESEARPGPSRDRIHIELY